MNFSNNLTVHGARRVEANARNEATSEISPVQNLTPASEPKLKLSILLHLISCLRNIPQ